MIGASPWPSQLPWHDSQWATFVALAGKGRVPHALLLHGAPGVGKQQFAQRMVGALLCEAADKTFQACGGCRGCRLLAAGSHPDLSQLEPPEPNKSIGIDAVRELIATINLTAQYAGFKLAVVTPAEAMTTSAANSLLKTLEEPPGPSVFVLVAHNAALLPATIRSRCQTIDFPVPRASTALEWLVNHSPDGADPALRLALAGGAPLAAAAVSGDDLGRRQAVFEDFAQLLEGDADPVAVAGRWKEVGAARVLTWLNAFTSDLVRVRADSGHPEWTINQDVGERLRAIAPNISAESLFSLLDKFTDTGRILAARISLNEQLVAEDLAVAIAGARSRR